MAFVLADRVKESSITSGTSDLVLGAGSFGGFETFSQGVGDGNQTYYGIENFSRWEVGIGTYTEASDILSRDTVLASSNSDGKISLDGISVVFCTYPGGQSFLLDANGVASGISSSAHSTITPFTPLRLGDNCSTSSMKDESMNKNLSSA